MSFLPGGSMFQSKKKRDAAWAEKAERSRREVQANNAYAAAREAEGMVSSAGGAGGQDTAMKEAAAPLAKSYGQTREEGKQSGRIYGEEFMGRDIRGMTPRERIAQEEGAQRKINKHMQGYQRQLVGQQGTRGVRGGAAYAQQADLARAGLEQQRESLRDINQMDSDIAMKKRAALFAIEYGEGAQKLYDRQIAENKLRMEDETKRQKGYEREFQHRFQRV